MRVGTHFKHKGKRMRTLTEGIKDAVGSVFCASARAASGVGNLLSSLPITIDGIQTQIDRYRAFACGDDPMDSPPVATPPPFTGGQCEGVIYVVAMSINNVARSGTYIDSSTVRAVSGAVLGLEVVASAAGWTVELVCNSGAVRLEVVNYGIAAWGQAPNAAITSVSRQDGGADNCGDPPLTRPEPVEEVDDELDITYDDPFGNPVTLPNVPIKFFKPCINLDGIRVPFELETPFGKICGKVGVSPDFPDIIEPSIDIDLCPEQRKDLGYKEEEIKDFFDILEPIGDLSAPAVPSISGTLTENYDLESLPILGAFVRGNPIDFGGNKTIVLNDDGATNPNIVIPRIGSVFFEYLIKTESGYESAFSEDIPIKNANQFIPCPWVFGAVKVHFRREFNCKVAIVPVARKSCCSSCEGNDPNKGLDDLDRCRID